MLTKKSNVVDISLQKFLSLSYQDIFDGKWNIPLTLIQKSIIRAYVDLVVSTSNAYVDKEQLYVHLAKQPQIAPYLPNTEGFSGDLAVLLHREYFVYWNHLYSIHYDVLHRLSNTISTDLPVEKVNTTVWDSYDFL